MMNSNLQDFLDHTPMGAYTGRGDGEVGDDRNFFLLYKYYHEGYPEVGFLEG